MPSDQECMMSLKNKENKITWANNSHTILDITTDAESNYIF